MGFDLQSLRDSFARVSERSPHVLARFYEILFARYVELRPLFAHGPEGMARQEKMLADALRVVLEQLDQGDALARTLAALGARHVRYGVRDEMYGWVGECLIAALAEGAGSDWSMDLEAQWSDAFAAIAAMMLAGAEPARCTPSRTSGAAVV